MQKIGLLLDSTAITRDDILVQPFVKAVALGVTIDGVDRPESEVSEAEMLEALHSGKRMTTSQPAPGEFLRAFQAFHEEGFTHVLVIVLSDKISGTFQAAGIAKGMIDFPLEVEIFAAQVASFGVALGAMPVITAIAAGGTFEDVVAKCHVVFADARVLFTLADLMNLFRGGRLNRIVALIGTVLHIKPVIEMIDGKLVLTKKERTNAACYDYFLETVRAYCAHHANVNVDVIHLNRAEWADRLANSIANEFPDVVIHRTNTLSPVFYIHLGDQGFGIALVGD